MRPVNLVISAFGPYAGKTVIEMDRLGKKGIYLITGDTGSGKTTIFDAITYALYGQASGTVREAGMLRSKYAEPDTETFVDLVFEYGGQIYQIRRNPEYQRPSKRGEGFTRQKADACLTYPDGKVLTKTREVTAAVEEILGIDCLQFTQIAMIAQGDFLKLLLAKTEERKAIFRQIFKTQRYEALQNKLKEAYSLLEKQRQEGEQSLHQYRNGILYPPSWEKGEEMSLEESLEELKEIISQDQKTCRHMEQETEQNSLQLAAISQIIGKAEAAEAAKKELERVKEAAEQERNTRLQKEENLKRESEKLPQKEQLEKMAAQLRMRLPGYDRLEQVRKQIKDCTKKQDRKEAERKQAELSMKEGGKKLEAEKQELEELKLIDVEAEKLEQAAGEQETMLSGLKRLEEHIRAWEATAKERDKAAGRYSIASQKAAELLASYNEKNSAFLSEQAGILAKDLKDGKPCPVCGSPSHPAAAALTEKAPTEAQVNEAKSVWEKAGEEQSRASARAGELKGREESQRKELLREAEGLLGGEGMPVRREAAEQEPFTESSFITDRLRQNLTQQKELAEKNLRQLKKEQQQAASAQKRKKHLEQQIPETEEHLKQLREELLELEKAILSLIEMIRSSRREEQTLIEDLPFDSRKQAEKEIQRLEQEGALIEKGWDQARQELGQSREREAALEGSLRSLKQQAEETALPDLTGQLEKQRLLKQKGQELSKNLRTAGSRLDQNLNILEHLEAQSRQQTAIEKRWAQVKALSDTANGNLAGKEKIMIETYVQTAYFDRILARANTRFMVMSGGQYELKRCSQADNYRSQTGLELDVIDHYNGTERSVKTLSGGEAFKASLSLALGLSDEIQSSAGGVRLDTMFVDEGFGSLDEESLHQAVSALAGLTEGNRLVGIISHVAELKEKIDCKITVKKEKSGGSRIEF